MFMSWFGPVGALVAGIVLIVVGQIMMGAIMIGVAVLLAVLSLALRPIMRSSREIAEQSGLKVSRLTGAPTMRSSMQQASDSMAAARQQMQGHLGLGGGALSRSGTPGTGMVKIASDTGRKSNLNPVYEVTVIVTVPGRPKYETVVETEVNALAIAQCVPGTSVPVKVDPSDPNAIWIDWLAVAGSGQASG
jgi:hypothetical protein